MASTLLVLAAGMGSRYGGLKQIDPVGPAGETLLDYAVFDALRAGFSRVVFVIRRDFEALFRETIAVKYSGRTIVDYAFQAIDALPPGISPPPGRQKPWGTGHAVWCAREIVRENFAVINADDFYGADSFVQLHRFLSAAVRETPPRFVLVGFRLANTLSEHGPVSRGICTVSEGTLSAIVEQTGIAPKDVGAGRTYSESQIVSMNCWGFTPDLFPALDRGFQAFLEKYQADPKAEFYLPTAVSAMIAGNEAAVDVAPTSSAWFGITYREDKPRVAAAIADLVGRGIYPPKLFS